MKKKLFIGLAGVVALAVSTALCFSVNSKKELTLVQKNLEALTQSEVTGNCGNSIPMRCYTTCSSCGAVWEAYAPGPASNVTGTCTCGASF